VNAWKTAHRWGYSFYLEENCEVCVKEIYWVAFVLLGQFLQKLNFLLAEWGRNLIQDQKETQNFIFGATGATIVGGSIKKDSLAGVWLEWGPRGGLIGVDFEPLRDLGPLEGVRVELALQDLGVGQGEQNGQLGGSNSEKFQKFFLTFLNHPKLDPIFETFRKSLEKCGRFGLFWRKDNFQFFFSGCWERGFISCLFWNFEIIEILGGQNLDIILEVFYGKFG